MASLTTTCAYCNAIVPVPASAGSGQRIPCPRCGEVFPYLPGQAVEGANEDWSSSTEAPVAAGLSNRALGLLVLSGMGLMALLTLVAALQTVGIRRGNDLGITKPQQISIPLFIKLIGNLWVIGLALILFKLWRERGTSTAARPRWLAATLCILTAAGLSFVFFSGTIRHRSSQGSESSEETVPIPVPKPAQLESLAYLPSDSNLVAAIHVREALHHPHGRKLLEDLRLGALELGTDHIEKWTGLKWEDIDELAFALKIDGQLIPRPTLIVHGFQPHQAARILKKLHAVRIPEAAYKDCYRIQWGDSGFKPTLWCPAEGRTLIVALAPADLDASLGKPRQGIEHLPASVQTMLRERMNAPTPIWAVATSQEWDKTILTQVLANLPAQTRDMLLKVRTLGVWLEIDTPMTVNAAGQCVNAATATELASYLQGWAKPYLEDVRTVADGTWFTAQGHGSLINVSRALAPGQPDVEPAK